MRWYEKISKVWSFKRDNGETVINEKNVYRCSRCGHETMNLWSMTLHAARIHKFDIPIRKKR